MIVKTKTIITFELPAEYNDAVTFEEQHANWRKEISTRVIGFSKESMFSVNVKEGESNETD